jgi:sirohydrochlorin cobaltochelatase
VLAQELARRMRRTGRYAEVAVGFMRGEPSIEDTVARITSDTIRIYPLFLSDGYYVSEAIPSRLGISEGIDALGRRIVFEVSLGLDPGLPGLLAAAVAAAAARRGLASGAVNLLVVAHGSRHAPNSADIARAVARGVKDAMPFASVDVSFLEEEPLFRDAIRTCARPVFVLGLFAGGGMHATNDVGEAIKALGDARVFGIDQLGGYAGVIEMIAGGLNRS